jgi:hypothetical protein
MKIEIHELNEGDIVAFKHGANLEFEDDGKILDLWEDESVVSVRCDAIDDELEINCSQIFAVDQSSCGQDLDAHIQMQIDLARGK